ncbi:hypothetical protein SECTIM467_57 [Brevibacillus phage SecTim467]|uniref:Uncharacterized protein n=2 Tax=Jenstvirus jenst TaxID=1982225 RepID=A0A0K2CPL0_9CAUD|nr:hypothetical protein AVV11_gp134 [Brevibacillus phage Jenst]ALA07187.1 putative membrane protein [Brevibacillus phage Jenst]ALA07555.1 hypothetical protein SECTIM467_57 [Brevibacillus phage SecTim467]
MEMIAMFILVAFLTETLTEILKNMIPNDTIQDKGTYVLSIVIGVILAYAFALNPFALVGAAKHVSIVSAGLIASRGANFVNGFMKQVGIIKSGSLNQKK